MKTRGFSLMEVMVAVALLAIVGGLLYQSLTSSIQAKEIVEGTSDRYHLARQALSRMTDEISMAYLSTHHNTTDPRSQTWFKGERDKIEFTAMGYEPRVADSKRGGTREIAYFVELDERTDEDGIIRREQPDPDIELDEGGREQTLLPFVTELEFEYWDATTEDWKDEWDSQETATLNQLPQRVKISFTMKIDPQTDREQKFYTQSRVFLTRPIDFD